MERMNVEDYHILSKCDEMLLCDLEIFVHGHVQDVSHIVLSTTIVCVCKFFIVALIRITCLGFRAILRRIIPWFPFKSYYFH